MDGADPDSGTCWECGYSYAKGKKVVLFRSDIRGSGDEHDIPYNAMLIGAADAHIELELASLDGAAAASAERFWQNVRLGTVMAVLGDS